jgi:hypothetical protein
MVTEVNVYVLVLGSQKNDTQENQMVHTNLKTELNFDIPQNKHTNI